MGYLNKINCFVLVLAIIFFSCSSTPKIKSNIEISNTLLLKEIEKYIKDLPGTPLFDNNKTVLVIFAKQPNDSYNIVMKNCSPLNCMGIVGYSIQADYKVYFFFENTTDANLFITKNGDYKCEYPEATKTYHLFETKGYERYYRYKNDSIWEEVPAPFDTITPNFKETFNKYNGDSVLNKKKIKNSLVYIEIHHIISIFHTPHKVV